VKKSTSLAAAVLVAAVPLAYAAPAVAGGNDSASASVRVSDPRADASGPRGGPARIDIVRVVCTAGPANGFHGKAVVVRVGFAGEAPYTARMHDTVRVTMTAGRRTFLLVAKPRRAPGAPGGVLPDMRLHEVFDDGSRSSLDSGRMVYNPGARSVTLSIEASALTQAGVSTIDTVRTAVVSAGETARDRTAASGSLPLR